MKFKSLGTKMLVILLAVNWIGMIVFSVVSYNTSKSIIENQIGEEMSVRLKSESGSIHERMSQVSTIAEQLAHNVESSYKATDLSKYEDSIGKIIYQSDIIMGSGVWFEPYVYDQNSKYIGPYVDKNGDTPELTMEYSNEDYNYFGYDWYKKAKDSKDKKAVFTKLYYDDLSDTVMCTCAAPMYDNGNFIGVVTVDTNILNIQNMVKSIKVGEEGKAELLDNDGLYVAALDNDKIMKTNMKDDDNAEISAMSGNVLNQDTGKETFKKDGKAYDAYYTTIDTLGWKLLIEIPQSQVNAPLHSLMMKIAIICVVLTIASVIIIFKLVKNITDSVKKVSSFALKISDGDFSIDKLNVDSEDEVGDMSTNLNKMLTDNKKMIENIKEGSDSSYEISDKLNSSTHTLKSSYNDMKKAVENINDEMMTASSSTEELNASVEEVNSSISILEKETDNNYDIVAEIKKKIDNVKKQTLESKNKAINLAKEHEDKVNRSVEDAKVVHMIGSMAQSISEIAEQVNVLSLNASIEAARAGEQGKGFAVVASEIGKLASQTNDTVKKIINVTDKVQNAFDNLTDNSKELLVFLNQTVTPDYEKFSKVTVEYGADADSIEKISNKIAEMTGNIGRILDEIGKVVEGIAASSQNTAENSGNIVESMNDVSNMLDNIDAMVTNEKEISDNLSSIVSKFKLK